MSGRKKHLDFELNLIPFIDLLSTCICFLLLTAVWLQIGAVGVKQAVGGQPASETEKKPTLWVAMQNNGDLGLEVRDAKVPGKLSKMKISGKEGKPNLPELSGFVEQLKIVVPNMNTALIQPQAVTVYEDIIDIMDQFKRGGIGDLGVSPL